MVYIQHADSLTALGETQASWRGLSEGRVALERRSVPHVEGEDLVPQAWLYDTQVEGRPRWWGHLERLRQALPDRPWGSESYPIYVTSSNYGIDYLFELSIDRETEAVRRWATPHHLVSEIREAFGWGPNVTIYSHACVTGQLGLLQAERAVSSGRAEQALVFSFDFLSPFVIGGFHSLKILNEGMPAPYHDGESGSIGLGEGRLQWSLGRNPVISASNRRCCSMKCTTLRPMHRMVPGSVRSLSY